MYGICTNKIQYASKLKNFFFLNPARFLRQEGTSRFFQASLLFTQQLHRIFFFFKSEFYTLNIESANLYI